MIAALLLVSFAILISAVGHAALAQPWATRTPRVAILGWQALSTSVVTSMLLAAIALALPFLPLRFSLASLLGAHAITVVEHYETPLGVVPGVVGLLLVTVVAGMLATTTTRNFTRTRRIRRAQLDSLQLVGAAHPDGFTVIDHDVPVAYCLPGRGTGTVVLSSAALALLDERERALVLGHERQHLRARHDLALAYSAALHRTFPWLPLFATAHREIAVLLEMAADDSATSAADRRALARAIVALGTGVRPETALAASDTAAVLRVRRLVSTVPSTSLRSRALAGAVVAFVMTAPIGLALAPAAEAATSGCCSATEFSLRP
jgi:Zn-dependent protease with chaperone function